MTGTIYTPPLGFSVYSRSAVQKWKNTAKKYKNIVKHN